VSRRDVNAGVRHFELQGREEKAPFAAANMVGLAFDMVCGFSPLQNA
jgi:hypothetical protein